MVETEMRHVVVLRDFSYVERQAEEEFAIECFLQSAPETVEYKVLPPGFVERGDIEQADVIISFGIKRYPDQVFESLLAHPRHVHVAQDWWEPVQPQSRWRNRLLEGARAVVFYSPLHAKRYQRLYQIEANTHIVPIPMPASNEMCRDGSEPVDAALWCAPWHPDNGSDILIRWSAREEKLVHAYGLGVPIGMITPTIEGCGGIALRDNAAVAVFQRYSQFVFFPRTPVPFGLPALLAYALGLEVSYSGEIGCLSFGDPDALIDKCAGAAQEFWRVVEEAIA